MGQDASKCGADLSEKRYQVERTSTGKRGTSLNGRKTSTGVGKCPVARKSFPTDMVPRKHTPPSDDGSEVNRKSSTASSYGRSPKTSVTSKHFLTRRERILIEQSWKKTRKSGTEHIGTKIFFMVLSAEPDIKPIFGLEKIPQGRLKYDPRFRQHALVYTRTFDYVVKNLDYPDKLESHFESLGRRHVVMQGRGFDPHHWEVFAECMTQAAVEWEANRQRPTLGAWRSLISNIITFMRRGFDEDNAKRRASTIVPSNNRRLNCTDTHRLNTVYNSSAVHLVP